MANPSQPQRAQLYRPKGDKIEQGTAIVRVANTKLAACLLAVGVPLYEGDPAKPDEIPPYVRIRFKDRTVRTTYNFYPRSLDGKFSTGDLCKGWLKDLDYIAANPDCQFAAAMATVKNLELLAEHHRTHKPYAAYSTEVDGRPATLLVFEGSKKEKAAIARGFRRI